MYGNFDLQKDDHDGLAEGNVPPMWGAVTNPPIPQILGETSPILSSGTTASLAIHEYVRQLQEDLLRLGFGIVGIPDGKFNERTQWAVREFQIYAKMEVVAKVKSSKFGQLLLTGNGGQVLIDNTPIYYDSSAVLVARAGQDPAQSTSTDAHASYYVDSLEAGANQKIYSGPVSGVVNGLTRQSIEFWLENHYRCPLVIEAWTVNHSGERTTLVTKGCNLWAHDDLGSGTPRIFSIDFTSYYAFPSTRNAHEYQALGYYEGQSFGGPSAGVKHSWKPEAEMSLNNVLGSGFDVSKINSSSYSTYRTIRVVAEAECFGRYDVINSWDNALLSAGPCHWTMGLYADGRYQKGEFPAFIAYFKSLFPDQFTKAIGFFGLAPSHKWEDESIYSPTTRTYATWLSLSTDLYIESNAIHGADEYKILGRKKEEAHYLKTWHWFYRFSMAGRTIQGYRKAMWKMAANRITKILEKEVVFTVGGSDISAQLGEIFTSEKSVAILLRWHVYRPSHVVSDTYGRVVPAIQDAISNFPALGWDTTPSLWTNFHESALTAALLARAANVNSTISTAINYGVNQSQGSVREARNSFLIEV